MSKTKTILSPPVGFKSNNNGYSYLEDAGYVFHPGKDYNYGSGGDDLGLPVYAICEGIVEFVDISGKNGGWGEHVWISNEIDGDIYMSHYAHMQEVTVKQGDWIRRSEQIGEISGTGGDWSPHLHLEIVEKEIREHPDWTGWQFYPTKKQGWKRRDVADYYVDPEKLIEDHKQTEKDEEFTPYLQAAVNRKFIDSVGDQHGDISRGATAKFVMNAHDSLERQQLRLHQSLSDRIASNKTKTNK